MTDDIHIDQTMTEDANWEETEYAPFILDYRDVEGEVTPDVAKKVVDLQLDGEGEFPSSIGSFLIIGSVAEYEATADVIDERGLDIGVEHLGVPAGGMVAFRELSEDIPITTERIVEEFREELLE